MVDSKVFGDIAKAIEDARKIGEADKYAIGLLFKRGVINNMTPDQSIEVEDTLRDMFREIVG